MSMEMQRRRTAAAIMVLCVAATPALAEGRDCNGYDSLKNNPKTESGKIVSTEKRVYFIKGESDDKACPSAAPACLRKGFLVPGNDVILSATTGDFVCATYVNAKGTETNGWLPKSVVAVTPATEATASDFVGTWSQVESKITIKPGAGDLLTVHGDATYGALDPDRVKRGAVNIGEINGKVAPKGGQISFAMGENDKTDPVDKGDDSVCKVWMRRVGPNLLVDDNNSCGGMNVSFRGTYVRK